MATNSQAAFIFGAVVVMSLSLFRRLRTRSSEQKPVLTSLDYENRLSDRAKRVRKELAEALPRNIVLPQDTEVFEGARDAYWAKQETEAYPSCYVIPDNVEQLCTAVSILGRALEQGTENQDVDGTKDALFAVRCGGHSHAPGASSAEGGVLIDLKHFKEISISEDGSNVTFGAGLRWKELFKALEDRNLVVVGARNAEIGVGGFTLGSGYSFYSPQHGFAGSNILSYTIVLASGQAINTSSTTYPNLFRALKGGVNNFGIVTSFTARTLPLTPVWSGFLFIPGTATQTAKALPTFHSYVTLKGESATSYDEHACGPITTFSYISQVGLKVISTHMAHTNPPADGSWPPTWKSSYSSLFRLWSMCKSGTHLEACQGLADVNPNGKRQVMGTTTIKNDPATLAAAHAAWKDTVSRLRRLKPIKGCVLCMNLQPLLPTWANKGDTSVMGLEDCTDPLVIVQYFAMYTESGSERDEDADLLIKLAVKQLDEFAEREGTSHRYRFTNYAAGWQDPIEGYGEENVEFLRRVSKEVDPEGLFQRGCRGGFKLGMKYE